MITNGEVIQLKPTATTPTTSVTTTASPPPSPTLPPQEPPQTNGSVSPIIPTAPANTEVISVDMKEPVSAATTTTSTTINNEQKTSIDKEERKVNIFDWANSLMTKIKLRSSIFKCVYSQDLSTVIRWSLMDD